MKDKENANMLKKYMEEKVPLSHIHSLKTQDNFAFPKYLPKVILIDILNQ